MLEEFLTLTEAASFAGVHRQRVRRLVDKIATKDDPKRRSLIRPTAEEYLRLSSKNRRFEWTIAKSLVAEHFDYELEAQRRDKTDTPEANATGIAGESEPIEQVGQTGTSEATTEKNSSDLSDENDTSDINPESLSVIAAKEETITLLTNQLDAKDKQINKLIDSDAATKLLVASYQTQLGLEEGDSTDLRDLIVVRAKKNWLRKIIYGDPVAWAKQKLRRQRRDDAVVTVEPQKPPATNATTRQ